MGVKFHPILNRYYSLCWQFLTYLWDKEHVQIIIEGYDHQQDGMVFSFKPYMHRWKPEYMKARIAKFYLLDEWAKNNPLPLSLLTFTTYHDSEYARRMRGKGCTIEESWDLLKVGFWKASLLIRNKIRKGFPTTGLLNLKRIPAILISTRDTSRNLPMQKRTGSRITGQGSLKQGITNTALTSHLSRCTRRGG